MSDRSSPDQNVYTRSAVWRMFRDAADEDYLTARIAARAGLHFQFFWSSQQSIEKYLKSILLLNNYSTVRFGHKITPMYEKALDICGDLLPLVLCPPKRLRIDLNEFCLTDFEPSIDYIARVQEYGDPNNRYRTFSVAFDFYDLNKLDQLCFLLRRVSFGLDAKIEELGNRTARELLTRNRSMQLHPKMGFDGHIYKCTSGIILENFQWRNFAYFYDEAVEKKEVKVGFRSVNSELSLAFEKSGVSSQRRDAIRWIAENAFPHALRTEVMAELDKHIPESCRSCKPQ